MVRRESHKIEIKKREKFGLNSLQLMIGELESACHLKVYNQRDLHIKFLELCCKKHASIRYKLVLVRVNILW